MVIEPLLIDEDYYARVEGREIISNLAKVMLNSCFFCFANHSRLLDRSVVRTGLVVRQSDTNMRASRPGVNNSSVLNLHQLGTNPGHYIHLHIISEFIFKLFLSFCYVGGLFSCPVTVFIFYGLINVQTFCHVSQK